MKAKVAHYYGWTDEVISRMAWRTFFDYYKSIEIIKTENLLLGYKAAVFPNLKPTDQKKEWRVNNKSIERRIDDPTPEQKKLREFAANF